MSDQQLPSNFTLANNHKEFELWKIKKLIYDIKAASTNMGGIDNMDEMASLQIVLPPGEKLSDICTRPEIEIYFALKKLGLFEEETDLPFGLVVCCYVREDLICDSFCFSGSSTIVRKKLKLVEVLESDKSFGCILMGENNIVFGKLYGNNLKWVVVQWPWGTILGDIHMEAVEFVANKAESFVKKKNNILP